ncbi:MAG: hypothetical protein ACI4WR_06805 [Bulleidia sp.]
MKKKAMIGSLLAAGAIAFASAVPAFAASDPEDDSSTYSYVSGEAAYEARMAESHPWFDDEDDAETADYSYNIGTAAAEARRNSFAGMPSGDDLTDEELEEFYAAEGIGEGAAYADGSYDETMKSGYGYTAGQSAEAARAASFAGTAEE